MLRRETALALLVLVYACVSVVAYTDVPRDASEPGLSKIERRGLDIWRRENCQACHQIHGFGGFLGPDLTNRVTDSTSDEEFAAILEYGNGRMPALGLQPPERRAVLAFLRYLARTGRAIPEPLGARRSVPPIEHHRLIAAEWCEAEGRELEPAVRRGCEVWTREQCGKCHVPFDRGTKLAPDLSGATTLRSAPYLAELLAQGRRNMPSCELAPDEIADLAAFLDWFCAHRGELVETNDRMLARDEFSWRDIPWFEYR
ncbi:MAG: c-type cytochrome [Planctomycetes bacterium]|nr:c-type cytochrome [Planctomycetota bacterium]